MPLTDKRYKVYRHTNKVNGKVYIGITKQSVERRWQNGKGYDRTYFGNAIRKYGWDSFEHSVLISGVDKETACFIEKTLIALYKSNTRECGYNICEGGQTGDNLSPHCGEDNCRATSVKRIDPKTNEVVIYRTVNEAAISMGINYRGISKACRGISKTYKGFVWEYYDRPFDKPQKLERGKHSHKYREKKVLLIENDGQRKEFSSISMAASETGIRANTISRYVTGIRNDPSGRRWLECL